ncbi:MAG: anthranilate synthase component I family protein [Flavobacteriaceae bacterium]
MKFVLKTDTRELLTDTMTPVNMYLKIRDAFPESVLLESSDYGANDNSVAYLCFNPIASFKVHNGQMTQTFPDGTTQKTALTKEISVVDALETFISYFETNLPETRFLSNGLFGYTAYEAVQYFEDISFEKKENNSEIPEIYYALYQNIIAVNVFNNQAKLFAHCYKSESNLDEIEKLLKAPARDSFAFRKEGASVSNMSDADFVELVKKGIHHCMRGDVFQIVLSRRFKQAFKGDDFSLYRVLRSINPSPYIFYFDLGNFKIFGSSPEAQLVVQDGVAEIHPIAGTFIRTGNDAQDEAKAKELAEDLKENAEHMMLVDLARNDLSRHGHHVTVEKDREVQFYSHVIHLVSKVTGQKKTDTSTMQVVADTFPAGTLSGAPKHRAMQLIDAYENSDRAFYGGAIGFIDFKGNYNHAIIIRSFLSKENVLHYHAGAGVVSKSNPESELQEVYNKLRALNTAMDKAEKQFP